MDEDLEGDGTTNESREKEPNEREINASTERLRAS